MKERAALANRIRGLLGEYGIVVTVGLARLRRQLPEILEGAGDGLAVVARQLFAGLQEQLVAVDKRVADCGDKTQVLHQGSEVSRRLAGIPGIGPITATALLASPSGGKPKLPGISKRGDVYLRALLTHGARAAVKTAVNKDDSQSRWINGLAKRRNRNIAAVAVANKNARTVWALLTKAEAYVRPIPMETTVQ